jgi:tagaturonate reductase
MILNAEMIHDLKSENLVVPAASLLSLPEKILQFGTGVLLRGLPDHFIHEANKQHVFNGRVVVVKSTESGGSDLFEDQNGLFTVFVRGFEEEKEVDLKFINASISRVLSANKNWQKILACAENLEMQIIISNTTEVGINLVKESIFTSPPVSFPAKLLSFLWHRYQFFQGAKNSGMVIIPTELISENGTILKKIVMELAAFNQLDQVFINWLNDENDFCSSLVDRIVPGKLSEPEKSMEELKLGYTDDLMIMCEPYCLWAIETSSERTKSILSFASVNKGIKIATDINQFKELKLRLLNGTHSFSCALALYCGFDTVREAMCVDYFRNYIASVMMHEIKPLIISDSITEASAQQFSEQVIDRFRNNSIEHKWTSISMQYSSKMAMRTVPLMVKYFSNNHAAPTRMILGFSAYLMFMNTKKGVDNIYYSKVGEKEFPVIDDKAALLNSYWHSGDLQTAITLILKDTRLWGSDLYAIPDFANQTIKAINELSSQGAENILRNLLSEKLAYA